MKNWIKETILKIMHGFLFGIGLVIAISISGYALNRIFGESSDKSVFITSSSSQNDQKEKNDESKDVLKIVGHSDKSEGNKLMITGKIKNTGKSSWDYVVIQVELYSEDKFVYECEEYLNELDPRVEENFLVSCGGCSDFVLPKYDRYTIRVVSANKKFI